MSTIRTLTSIITLIFGLMLINEWNIYFYKPPKFHELKFSEGTICFGILKGRYGRPLCLVSDSKKIIFKSKLREGFDDGYMRYLNSRKYKDLLNKNSKIWWREETYLGFSVNRLYQLEVDGELLVKYSDKKIEYLNDKSSLNFYAYAIFFNLCLFIIMSYSIIIFQEKRQKIKIWTL